MISGRKHKGGTSAGGEQSWRSLVGGGIDSPESHKRRQSRLYKLFALLLVLFIIAGSVTWVVLSLKQRGQSIELTTPSKPVERVLYSTDGVLSDRWLSSVLELHKGMTLMEIDIHVIKQDLEEEGQVAFASVRREFPDALEIKVKERVPALRMRVAGKEDRVETRIVARDGTIYKGVGYTSAMLSRLPYVVPYQHQDGSVKPMRGIEKVAQLLDQASRTQPSFYKSWQLIDLEHYTGESDFPGQIIEVKTSTVPRIIFGTNSDFSQQLDRLGVIMNYVQSRGNPSIKRIDLSLLSSAAVQFESGRIRTF